MSRDLLSLEPLAGADFEVGRWLSAIEEARRRLFATLEEMGDVPLDETPPGHDNSIGTLLYHVAVIEADWLYEDILGTESGRSFPLDLFPFEVREADGRLQPVVGLTLEQHLDRLATVRGLLLDELRAMSREDFHRVRAREDYDVSPDWVLHHLMQHEAEHRAQIAVVGAALTGAE